MTLAGLSLARHSLDGGLEEDGGGGAVDVVVAVDEDGLGGADGLLDAGDGGFMPSMSVEGRGGRRGLGWRKRLGGREVCDAAGDEEGRDGGCGQPSSAARAVAACRGVDGWECPSGGRCRSVGAALYSSSLVVDDDVAEVGRRFR